MDRNAWNYIPGRKHMIIIIMKYVLLLETIDLFMLYRNTLHHLTMQTNYYYKHLKNIWLKKKIMAAERWKYKLLRL